DGKLLPLGARIAELGTQNLWCAGDAAVQFLRFFQERGAKVSMTETEAIKVANGGYLGSLLSGVGFDYTAFDIFEAPNTRLMDLNIHFVPSDLNRNLISSPTMEQPNTFSTKCLQCVRCTISP